MLGGSSAHLPTLAVLAEGMIFVSSKNPRVEETDEKDLVVGDGPKSWAAGIPGVLHSMVPAIEHMGVNRTRKTVLAMNQKKGFDCPSCAWPDPKHRKTFEFCENGAKAVTWEATPVVIGSDFWAEHPVSELRTRSEYWLGMQGRLTEPVYKPAGEDHYRPISWDEAINLVGNKLKSLASPHEAMFYTSGRTSNEAAFAVPAHSCAAMARTICPIAPTCATSPRAGAWVRPSAIGKATVSFEDFANADLIIVMGQNPGTNHPQDADRA